jgi:hypothetical protein
MAWEARGQAGQLYYYRCKRTIDGRVVKEYLGRGPRAQRVAQAAAEARRRAEEERQALADEKARLAEGDGVTDEVLDAVQLLTEAVLLSHGYHRQNHGPWRRRRHGH